MAMAVGLLILVIALAIVLTDLIPSRPPRAERPERELVPPGANDPLATSVASLSQTVAALGHTVGELAGRGAGGAAGSGVAGVGVEFSRGLASQPVAQEELAEIARNAVSGGTATGLGPASFAGGAAGAAVAFIPGVAEGIARGSAAAFGSLYRALDELGVFRAADRLGIPKL